MAELNDTEQRLVRLLEELAAHPDIQVDSSDQGDIEEDAEDVALALADVERVFGIELPQQLTACAFRGDYAARWRVPDDPASLMGEFALTELALAFTYGSPELAWDGSSAADRALYEQLRVIDELAQAGEGMLAAIRVEDGKPVSEIWFHNPRHGSVRLDLDYCGYLRNLSRTRGVYGWQYLFAEVSLGDDELSSFRPGLERMVRVFPELFPGGDYADLASRLVQRS